MKDIERYFLMVLVTMTKMVPTCKFVDEFPKCKHSANFLRPFVHLIHPNHHHFFSGRSGRRLNILDQCLMKPLIYEPVFFKTLDDAMSIAGSLAALGQQFT